MHFQFTSTSLHNHFEFTSNSLRRHFDSTSVPLQLHIQITSIPLRLRFQISSIALRLHRKIASPQKNKRKGRQQDLRSNAPPGDQTTSMQERNKTKQNETYSWILGRLAPKRRVWISKEMNCLSNRVWSTFTKHNVVIWKPCSLKSALPNDRIVKITLPDWHANKHGMKWSLIFATSTHPMYNCYLCSGVSTRPIYDC